MQLPCLDVLRWFSRRVHSGILRDMSMLGYLGQLQAPDIGAVLPLHSLAPYQVHGWLCRAWGCCVGAVLLALHVFSVGSVVGVCHRGDSWRSGLGAARVCVLSTVLSQNPVKLMLRH